MARTKTTVANLDKVINKILNQYAEITWDNIDEATKKIAKKVRLAVTSNSKQFDANGHWGKGKYSSGWRVKEDQRLWWNSYIIHNATKPTETHLIEYGHEVQTGIPIPRPNPRSGTYINKTTTRTKAYPHIGPVAEKVPDEVQTEVVNAVRRSS